MSSRSRHTFHLAAGLIAGFFAISALAAEPGGEPGAEPGEKDRPAPPVDYSRDIRPILSKNCFSCHGRDEKHRQGGLRLDERAAACGSLKSGRTAIVPGAPEKSALLERVSAADAGERMPPAETGNHLSSDQVELLRHWIREGAGYSDHWAFIKPVRRALPAVREPLWPRNAIDYFILARLESRGLRHSPPADPHELFRRASFDLRGLPPSPDEIEAFTGDGSPDAYEKAVDRMLADPGYGERWARMWLDLARYADSAGYGSDPLRLNIWPYRDWVIDAFNRNLSFDQFTIDQLAGDLLPSSTLEQRAATAFHRNTMTNFEGGTDDEEFRVAAIKDRADTTLQVWMGLTLGCAKCHNHKYDPISQREYYQVFGFFNQTEDADRPDDAPLLEIPTPELLRERQAIDERIAALKKSFDATAWTPLRPLRAASEGGATLEIRDDGAIAVSGKDPAADVYTISVRPGLERIGAIRLETLPDPSLPGAGAGRAPDGNFVLTRFSAAVKAADAGARSIEGRFVRIELPGRGKFLSLAEVEVDSGGGNAARKGKASQSSTDFEGPAQLAIDGNRDGNFHEARSTTHTAADGDAWWEVDLGEVRKIDQISIWNRTDGGEQISGRLSGFRVKILGSGREAVWEKEIDKAPMPSVRLAAGGDSRQIDFTAASADFSQDRFPAADALQPRNPAENGWAVAPRQKDPHAAVFAAAESPGKAAGGPADDLEIRLEHRFKDGHYTLGRFRLSATAQPVKPILDEIARLEKSRPAAPRLPVLVELPDARRRPTHILIKGNFLDKGDAVEAAVPQAFHSFPAGAPANRLGVARWLIGPDNPLTARVAVNRFWAQIFGAGLVESEEDFGSQGDFPSHPELLDWLAVEFQGGSAEGAPAWDIKALLRLMVTSQTYRQSARAEPDLLEADPRNRLLARAPRRRLEAEMIRDQAMALSGLLSRKMRGPSVYPPQPDGLWQAAFNGERSWQTSKGEDRYRRGLYTFWRRTVPYPSMETFDAPSREICSIRRISTNTPLQAFVTLNDPVYVEAAQRLARRLIREGGANPAGRIRSGLAWCLGRPPAAAQAESLEKLYRSEREHFQAAPEPARRLAGEIPGAEAPGADAAELAAWTVVANVLLNMDAVLTR